ncbi:MFS transporter [Paenibacillus sp. MY03]|jgi:UMF1 family MFS transporter|uniref:MFS transporter n=1 Tax=Paenibacillus sp. MY03 TaxID=302980 RepID=UPI000B3BE1A9|nr:MFS transporter [Paenibacillus sp. MY03]OUS75490.1 MFS transporter [Paenibacillus sp. MY03]
MKSFSKEERSWMWYDWGHSAYSVIISTAVFPLFYKAAAEQSGISGADSTAYLGYAIAISTLILALLGPILGTIADYQGFKKTFFAGFSLLGVISTALLTFIPNDHWQLLLICYVFIMIGSAGSNVFYDAFLVDVSDDERMNKVSTRGFALGYIGSTIPFIVSIAIILLAQQEVLPLSVTAASQIAFFITAVWWGAFTLPMLRHVRQKHFMKREPRIIANSFGRLWGTLKEIKRYRALFLFLLAYFFYIDGVGTIITMSSAYGSDLGIEATDLLIILFVTQVVAAPFAMLYGRLADRFGSKLMLYAGIVVYILVCIYAYFMKTAFDFWILAMLVATSQGGIQALSRSYFARMVPKQNANRFFGFYNIFDKFASILGPLLVGLTAQATGNTSTGVFSLVVLFLIGGAILTRVPEPGQGSAILHAPGGGVKPPP